MTLCGEVDRRRGGGKDRQSVREGGGKKMTRVHAWAHRPAGRGVPVSPESVYPRTQRAQGAKMPVRWAAFSFTTDK